MTKADVLSGFAAIKVCTHYEYNGTTIDYMPFDIVNCDAKPVYKELKGWNKDLTNLSNISEIPQELNDYILYLEKELKVPLLPLYLWGQTGHKH